MPIQVFDDINASHAATGYPGRTDLPSFHIFTVEDTYPHTRRVMPPYRFGFFQIVLLENSPDAMLHTNTQTLRDLNDTLFFASPDHVLAWVRGEAQRGYILYFKEDLLAHHPRRVLDEFPYFRLNDINYLPVGTADVDDLRGQFAHLLRVFMRPHPYRQAILASLLMALLYDCKRLHETQTHRWGEMSPAKALAFRFQQFVDQHYLTRKRVSDYADLLAISPDYLGQVVRAVTGKSPLRIIGDRVLLEAKKLLRYSELDVAEIASYLGYDEPTHFGRFFRKATGFSPRAWRRLS